MAIPLSYNIRNLMVRKTTTVMTAVGIALTIAVLLATLGLVHGLRAAFESSGDPSRIIVLRKGGNAELMSLLTPEQFQIVKSFRGIATGSDGQPLASMEIVTIVNVPTADNPDGSTITVRGLSTRGMDMRHLKLIAGRWFKPGLREIVVGKAIERRYDALAMGKQLKFGKGFWTVVGVMDSGGKATDSEIYADGNQIASDFNRTDAYSSAVLQATDVVAANALANILQSDRRLNVSVESEKEYFDAQTVSAAPVQYLGTFVCVIMAIGSAFAAMNTMYAAVSRRSKEIGTLRVLGFTKGSILLSFFLESVLLSLIGGIIACLIVLPLNGISTALGSFTTFSETSFNFKIGPALMLQGLLFSVLLGAAGGFLPARQAARKEILTSLREV